MRLPWLKHGFLNTLEHGFTRVADALVSLLLLSVLAPEIFSKLALAQAVVAPLLLFFIAPENVMYRDFSSWREEGPSTVAARLRAFRLFAWGKAQLAVLICIGSVFVGSSEEPWTRFAALVWAFSLVLAPQVAGPDREFMRLDLKLKQLNWLTLYQKSILLLGSLAVLWAAPGSLAGLAAVAAFSAVSTALIARIYVTRLLTEQGASRAHLTGSAGPSVVATLTESLSSFSIWNHLSGIVINWVQTMDLFFLGLLRFPARQVGLYASVLKIANFSTALPTAISSSFMVWTGRRISSVEGVREERQHLLRFSFLLAAGSAAQSLVLGALAPWILQLLSRGRWTPQDQVEMIIWFRWILGGTALFCSMMLLGYWLLIRSSVQALLARVYLPWLVLSLVIYGWSARLGGLDGVARANLVVGMVYAGLMGLFCWGRLSE